MAETKKAIMTKTYVSSTEQEARKNIIELFRQCPIPDKEVLSHLGLFIKRQDLSRILFMHELYQKILDVHGVIMEFGVRWGQNLAIFESLRGILEPYNHNRKIIGFDTFEGFPSVHEKDGDSDIIREGAYSVTEGYESYLENILNFHESESPISHIKKFQLVKGDATIMIADYLKQNPETIISFAYFDFDIYSPTFKCLEAIRGHITKGTIIGFDELNHHDFPGETLAFKEVLGLDRYKIRRSKYSSMQSYIIVE